MSEEMPRFFGEEFSGQNALAYFKLHGVDIKPEQLFALLILETKREAQAFQNGYELARRELAAASKSSSHPDSDPAE